MTSTSLARLFLLTIVVSVVPQLIQAGTTVTVTDGVVQSSGRPIGSYTSSLQSQVIDTMFPVVSKDTLARTSFANATVMRYLKLNGDYVVDLPLTLPPLFVVVLNGSLTPAANLSSANLPRFAALVTLNDTKYSAMIGGTVDASSIQTHMAVSVVNSFHSAVRGVRALANNSKSAIGVNGGSHNEISHNDVGGDGVMLTGRCIWTLATQSALVHDNAVHFCASHALDFDAYTSSSAAWSNVCTDNREEGIFVEETASHNFIFNNTLARNGNGIGVYSNAVGPVASNLFINNNVEGNSGFGITVGGYGHNPDKVSLDNTFVGNTASGNKVAAFDPTHGAVSGNYWTANMWDEPVGFSPYDAANASELAVFEPYHPVL